MKYIPLALSLLAAGPALAIDWALDVDASTVTIETTAFGRDVLGEFSNFEADIRLDPTNLGNALIEGRVMVVSGDTGNPQYNSEMTGSHGLNGSDHPVASFVSESIAASENCEDGDGECYVASGTLTLAGSAQPVDLVFRLSIAEGRAIADGLITVVRQEFGIGSDNWGASATTVEVRLHIEATA